MRADHAKKKINIASREERAQAREFAKEQKALAKEQAKEEKALAKSIELREGKPPRDPGLKKKIIIGVIIAVAVVGLAFGGAALYAHFSKKPVNVYSVSELAMTDDYADESSSSGTVTTTDYQKVVASGTQTIKSVNVVKGQKVHKGDVLMTYDTSLSDLQISRKQTEIKRLELRLQAEKKNLAKIKKMKPHKETIIYPEKTVEYKPHKTPYLIQGTGTVDDPAFYLWDEKDQLDKARMEKMLGSNAEVFIVLVQRENNALNAPVEETDGLHLTKADDGSVTLGLFSPDIPDSISDYEEIPEPYTKESGSSYTAAELARMKADTLQSIAELKTSIRIAEIDIQQMQSEKNKNNVVATINGVVKSAKDAKEANISKGTIVEVSAGGGYYVTGAASELELENIFIGQKVKISSWVTGVECEGKIEKISNIPTKDSGYGYYEGNQNVSYYEYKVFVSEDENLNEGDYVDIKLDSQDESGNSFYLENAFIRTETGRSFVYIQGSDGTLEKRTVSTGKDLWGYYTQIKSGLTMDDLIAFPYGDDVVEGAKTVEADLDALYESDSEYY